MFDVGIEVQEAENPVVVGQRRIAIERQATCAGITKRVFPGTVSQA